ncbi:DUF6985 domain-containing protein [Rothia aeria]|uniref:DUF6985 domain-containing protein n=1 Tax=Rothia aeria TaxID=172042 RepID=UPI0028D0DA13|nr:hypothetical protein [Rothia aeria]
MKPESTPEPESINFTYDTDKELYVSDPVDVPALKKNAVTFRFDLQTLDSVGWQRIRAAIDNFRSPDADIFAQATPYVYQFYRMYFDMADEYGWEQYLPDIPESQVWSLVGPIGDRCTVAWDNNSLLIVVEAETEWDIEHGMIMVYQDGVKLVKVGMAVESYTNPDGTIFDYGH